MTVWFLIALFHSGYSGHMDSMTSTVVEFQSKQSCEQAAMVLKQSLVLRNQTSNGLINGVFICVEDKNATR